jgi:hypothetical protein
MMIMETHGNKANASVVAEPVHLTFLLTIQQVVMVLHANKLGPSPLLSDKLH